MTVFSFSTYSWLLYRELELIVRKFIRTRHAGKKMTYLFCRPAKKLFNQVTTLVVWKLTDTTLFLSPRSIPIVSFCTAGSSFFAALRLRFFERVNISQLARTSLLISTLPAIRISSPWSGWRQRSAGWGCPPCRANKKALNSVKS